MHHRGAWRSRHAVVVLALLFAIPSLTRPLAAQQTDWTAMLQINPYPSPYLSDWETNPNIATLTLVNPTTSSQDVVLRYDIHNQQGALLASGRSDPQTIPAGSPTIYTSFVDIEGSSQHDAALESEMTTTGRIPEGVYTVCVLAADAQNLVLARTCQQFTIVYPDPPMLISPADGAVVSTTSPVFQWTPLQVPGDYQLRYILQIAEVHQGQTAAAALAANIPLYENRDVGSTVLEYPLDAQPFEQGKTYAWRVITLDQNGYPPSTNGGMSEIETFQYNDGSTPLPPPANSLATLQLLNGATDSGATTGTATDTASFSRICTDTTQRGTTPVNYVIAVNSRWGFLPLARSSATIYRKISERAKPLWWIYTARGHRELLVHGNCDGPLGGLEWIATKRSDHETLNRWLTRKPPTAGRPFLGDTLKYSAWAFALSSDSVWVPDSADFGDADFFDGNDFDVKPGVNAYAVLALPNRGLWGFFQRLGFQEKAITFQGFVGLDVSATLGIGQPTGAGASVDQSVQASFLNLSVALPDRKPLKGGLFYPIAKSMHLAIELEVKDSVAARAGVQGATEKGSGVNGANTLEIVPKITHTIVLKDDVAKHIQGSRQLVGQLQLDIQGGSEQTNVLSKSGSKLKQIWSKVAGPRLGAAFGVKPSDVPCAPTTTTGIAWKSDYVISYGLDGKVVLGPVYFDSPGIELHIDTKHHEEYSLAFATEVGFTNLNAGAILGLAIAPKVPPDSNEDVVGTREFAVPSSGGAGKNTECKSLTRTKGMRDLKASSDTSTPGLTRTQGTRNLKATPDTSDKYASANKEKHNPGKVTKSKSTPEQKTTTKKNTTSPQENGTQEAPKTASWRDKWNVYWKVAFPENLDMANAIKSLIAMLTGFVGTIGGGS